MGLQKQQHVKADALSGGMKRRLQVALALLGNSCVILLGTVSLTYDIHFTSMVIVHRMQTYSVALVFLVSLFCAVSLHWQDEKHRRCHSSIL